MRYQAVINSPYGDRRRSKTTSPLQEEGLEGRLLDCSFDLLPNDLLEVGLELLVGQDKAAGAACERSIASLHGTVPYERVQDDGPACPVPVSEAISLGSVDALGMADRFRDRARTNLPALEFDAARSDKRRV